MFKTATICSMSKLFVSLSLQKNMCTTKIIRTHSTVFKSLHSSFEFNRRLWCQTKGRGFKL